MSSQTYEDIYAPYQNVLNYLQKKSGIASISNIALMLHSTLKSQEDLGLKLPEWTKPVWPEPITTITRLDWQQWYATEVTRAIGAGNSSTVQFLQTFN